MTLVLIFGWVFLLFLVVSAAGATWIGLKAFPFGFMPRQGRPYRLLIIHTYSPKYWFFGWKTKIPARGEAVAKRGVELARQLRVAIFLPVGAVTVPGSGLSEADIYAKYLTEDEEADAGTDIFTSKNPAAKDTRSSLKEARAIAKNAQLLPLLMLATRAHLPRIARLLQEMKDTGGFGDDDIDLIAVECSPRYYLWEFCMYVADIHLLRPGSLFRRFVLNLMGRRE